MESSAHSDFLNFKTLCNHIAFDEVNYFCLYCRVPMKILLQAKWSVIRAKTLPLISVTVDVKTSVISVMKNKRQNMEYI